MKFMRTLVFVWVVGLLTLGAGQLACTAAQLANADKNVGGTPLPVGAGAGTTQPTTVDLTLHLIADTAKEGATIVSPIPVYGPIIAAALGVIGTIVGGLYGVSKSTALAQSNATIAAAALEVINAMKLSGASSSVVGAVGTAIGLAPLVTPGIAALLSHPAAANAIAASNAVSNATTSLNTK